jgi:transcriptional regulator with GAF, ATPase, and Fis domain
MWKEDLITLSSLRVPMSDLSGNRVGLCGIMRDLTIWRKAGSHAGTQADEYVSQAMKITLEQVRLAAEADSTVLFLGESGGGKDHLAKYLHDHSPRRNSPFFAINCAAIARDLADSELFGHEAGAFTGTRGRKRGLLELAEGGTLLLNEIGELPLSLQAKLLAFLDTQSFSRVGGEGCVTVNARIIAATNRDLEEEVEAGNFRKDLFYRLNVFPIRVPPLRERMEDLPGLVLDLLQLLSTKLGFHSVPEVDNGAMRILGSYHWPGNIRELKNVLERALILCDKRKITEKDVAVSRNARAETGISSNGSFVVRWSDGISMNETLNQTKRFLVEEGLRRSGGSIKEAASLLGISRGSLKHYLHYLGIQR